MSTRCDPERGLHSGVVKLASHAALTRRLQVRGLPPELSGRHQQVLATICKIVCAEIDTPGVLDDLLDRSDAGLLSQQARGSTAAGYLARRADPTSAS